MEGTEEPGNGGNLVGVGRGHKEYRLVVGGKGGEKGRRNGGAGPLTGQVLPGNQLV